MDYEMMKPPKKKESILCVAFVFLWIYIFFGVCVCVCAEEYTLVLRIRFNTSSPPRVPYTNTLKFESGNGPELNEILAC